MVNVSDHAKSLPGEGLAVPFAAKCLGKIQRLGNHSR